MHPELDPEPLEQIQALGGPELVARVTEAFLRTAPPRLEAAYTAALARHLDTLRFAMHSLKSSAASIGAREVQALAEEIEHYARRGDATPIPLLVKDLQRAYDRVVVLLRAREA